MAQETLLNNRYRLLAQQGAGGMAVIYKAQDMLLGRAVAVKILRPSLTSNPAFLERFREEARAAARLAHPNIVTVHDVGQDRNTHYIVMEFVEGKDLKRLIREEGPFSIDRALDIAIQICAGVGYAHRADLVHADVKPQNVLVTDDGTVKVTDFGIAQAFSYSAPGERQAVVWGSPHYFSPEQAQGEPPTPAADVYAIGVVLFEMLTGELPFKGKDHRELALAHIREEAPSVSDVNPGVPRKLGRIVRKVMAKEPSARYRTADQLGRILETYRRQGVDTTTRQPAAAAEAPPAAGQPTRPAGFGAPGAAGGSFGDATRQGAPSPAYGYRHADATDADARPYRFPREPDAAPQPSPGARRAWQNFPWQVLVIAFWLVGLVWVWFEVALRYLF
ncbi:MAG: hypothetical protein Kow00120_06580 [Anaerolineae bacterium]